MPSERLKRLEPQVTRRSLPIHSRAKSSSGYSRIQQRPWASRHDLGLCPLPGDRTLDTSTVRAFLASRRSAHPQLYFNPVASSPQIPTRCSCSACCEKVIRISRALLHVSFSFCQNVPCDRVQTFAVNSSRMNLAEPLTPRRALAVHSSFQRAPSASMELSRRARPIRCSMTRSPRFAIPSSTYPRVFPMSSVAQIWYHAKASPRVFQPTRAQSST